MNCPKLLLYPLGFLVLSAGVALAGQTSLSTYYPAPTGNYNQLTSNYVSIGTSTTGQRLVVMNGNVGIGTTAPDGVLDVFQGNTNGDVMAHFRNTGSGTATMTLKVGEGAPEGQWGEMTHYGVDNSFRIRDVTGNGSTRGNLLLNWDGGNVGIGVTAPTSILNIAPSAQHALINLSRASTSYVAGLDFQNAGTTYWEVGVDPAIGATGDFAFYNASGSTNLLIQKSSGNVGIGVTNPAAPLQVNNTSGYYSQIAGGTYSLLGNGTIQTLAANGSNWAGIFEDINGPYGIYASNASGYYAELAYSGYGLYTNGAVYSIVPGGNSYWAGVFENTTGPYGIYTRNASGYYAELAYSGYGLYTNGQIYASGTITSSDQRMKKDIRPIIRALDKVQRLNGVVFTWKKTGAKDIGVIAQNVEKVLPEIVHTGKDGMKGVEYGNLTALLIEAIKEQQKEINDQQKEIEGLEKKIMSGSPTKTSVGAQIKGGGGK